MDFFNKATNYLPEHWEKKDYGSETYHLVDLSEDSAEYTEIKALCAGVSGTVKKIKRIQHPFAYLRFKLREEFEKLRGENRCEEQRVGELVKTEEVRDYIKYNCDDRRKTFTYGGCKTYVIRKCVSNSPDRDSKQYPEYLVEMDLPEYLVEMDV